MSFNLFNVKSWAVCPSPGEICNVVDKIESLSKEQYLRCSNVAEHRIVGAELKLQLCGSWRRCLMSVYGEWRRRRRRSSLEGVVDVTRRCGYDEVTHVPNDVASTCTYSRVQILYPCTAISASPQVGENCFLLRYHDHLQPSIRKDSCERAISCSSKMSMLDDYFLT